MILCFTCVLAFLPALIMDSKLRVGLRKSYTKEKVSGELLTNAEQRTSMRAGGGVARHTHTWIKEAVLHANTVYSTCLQLQTSLKLL